MKKINIDDKEMIFIDDLISDPDDLPAIIISSEKENEERIKTILNYNIGNAMIVEITGISWDDDLTPWPAPAVFKGAAPYKGLADNYLRFIEDKVLFAVKENYPGVNRFIMAGYSLGGLFAIYTGYRSSCFDTLVSCSGSLWYPEFEAYFENNDLDPIVKKVYLSLGDKEKNTRNPLMSKVEDITNKYHDHLKSKGLKTIFELNEGNHFKDSDLRLAKGLKWAVDKSSE
jgi:predicted alpha/beta superfamily hydrolase